MARKAKSAPKTVAKVMQNFRAKKNGDEKSNGHPLLRPQFILTVEDVEGQPHTLILAQETVKRLAGELREHA